MNIWDTGSFDNDAAKDFVAEVLEDGAYALQEALDTVTDPDTEFVALEEGARAIAAAEIVAAQTTGDTGNITDAALREWLAHTPTLAPLREAARAALSRLQSPDSDLAHAWADDEDAQSWRGNVQRLQDALA